MPEAAIAPQAEPIAPKGAPAVQRFEVPEDPAGAPEAPAAPAEGGEPPAQNSGDKAPPATPEGEKPEPEVTPEQAAKRDGRRFERKLDKAYRQRAEAQARADQLEKQLAEFQKPKAPEGAPTLEQFDYDPEKYAQAVREHAKSQAVKEHEAKQKAETEKQHRQRLISGWDEQVAKADDKYEDFQEKVGDLQPTNDLTAAIMEAENGADVAYYLATHMKDAQRIAELPIRQQIREIGKLEAKLLAEPVKPRAPSKAPAPITPLTGGAPNVESVSLAENLSDKEWIQRRQRQVHGRR
jgi:hypothetical protein